MELCCPGDPAAVVTTQVGSDTRTILDIQRSRHQQVEGGIESELRGTIVLGEGDSGHRWNLLSGRPWLLLPPHRSGGQTLNPRHPELQASAGMWKLG